MEQTGNPQLDELIQRFAAGCLHEDDYQWHPSPREGDDPDAYRPVAIHTEPDYGYGMCSTISQQFSEFLEAHAPDIECAISEADPDHPNHTPEFFGYQDRHEAADANESMHNEEPYPTHCVVYIYEDGCQYMVDFAASQYGYTEFPMIQRSFSQSDPIWEREWDIEPERPILSDDKPQLPESTNDTDLSLGL